MHCHEGSMLVRLNKAVLMMQVQALRRGTN
jgi:hypothetical protein